MSTPEANVAEIKELQRQRRELIEACKSSAPPHEYAKMIACLAFIEASEGPGIEMASRFPRVVEYLGRFRKQPETTLEGYAPPPRESATSEPDPECADHPSSAMSTGKRIVQIIPWTLGPLIYLVLWGGLALAFLWWKPPVTGTKLVIAAAIFLGPVCSATILWVAFRPWMIRRAAEQARREAEQEAAAAAEEEARLEEIQEKARTLILEMMATIEKVLNDPDATPEGTAAATKLLDVLADKMSESDHQTSRPEVEKA